MSGSPREYSRRWKVLTSTETSTMISHNKQKRYTMEEEELRTNQWYGSLIQEIDSNINTNGSRAITGSKLNSVLNDMVSALGSNMLFGGVVTPSSSKDASSETPVFYFAPTAGTYTNLGNIVVANGEFAFIYADLNGNWQKMSWSIELDDVYVKPDGGIPSTDLATDVQTSLGLAKTAIQASEKGANSGVATLDSSGKVPQSQLPSYVDDVLEYANLASFPVTGESGKIYVALDTNKTYRWGGSTYVEIAQGLALGETSSTAFAGNRGKAIEDKIPSNASSSNKLATAADIPSVTGKADKVSGATNGNFAGLDANGNPTDSGHKHSDYATAAQGAKADTAVQQVTVGTTTTGAAGSNASVSNSGTSTAPVLDFTIPRGADGADAVNPFKGWWPDLATLKAAITAIPGDYAYIIPAVSTDPVAIYEYDSTATTDNYWSDSGRTFNPSNNQEFASGEDLNTVNIDSSHLFNPISGSLAKAEDTSLLASKLKDVEFIESVVDNSQLEIYKKGSSDTYSGFYCFQGTNAVWGRFGTASNASTKIDVSGYSSIRFLGFTSGTISTSNYGSKRPTYCFLDENEEVIQSSITEYPEIPTGGSATTLELTIDIPDGAKYLLVIYYRSSGNVINSSNFYCYKQKGSSAASKEYVEQKIDEIVIPDVPSSDAIPTDDSVNFVNSGGLFNELSNAGIFSIIGQGSTLASMSVELEPNTDFVLKFDKIWETLSGQSGAVKFRLKEVDTDTTIISYLGREEIPQYLQFKTRETTTYSFSFRMTRDEVLNFNITKDVENLITSIANESAFNPCLIGKNTTNVIQNLYLQAGVTYRIYVITKNWSIENVGSNYVFRISKVINENRTYLYSYTYQHIAEIDDYYDITADESDFAHDIVCPARPSRRQCGPFEERIQCERIRQCLV